MKGLKLHTFRHGMIEAGPFKPVKVRFEKAKPWLNKYTFFTHRSVGFECSVSKYFSISEKSTGFAIVQALKTRKDCERRAWEKLRSMTMKSFVQVIESAKQLNGVK